MTILTYLDLSTSHLTRETMDTLSHYSPGRICVDMGWPAMTIAPYEHGVFITVPPTPEADEVSCVPKDPEQVLAYARNAGIHLLRFDSDGDIVDGLPTYIWE